MGSIFPPIPQFSESVCRGGMYRRLWRNRDMKQLTGLFLTCQRVHIIGQVTLTIEL